MYRKRERRTSLPAATAITAVVLPLLLVYNLTVAVPATQASVEPEPQPAPVVSAAVELGASVGSGTEELLAAFQEAYPPVTQAAPIATAADPTTTTAAPPAPTTTTTTTAIATTTTIATTTAIATTTTTTTTTTAAPTTTTTTPPTTHTHPPTTTTVVAASPIDPYPWEDSWPEIAMWEKLVFCEATNDWHANTGNGYFGGLQFTQISWEYVGGTGRPDQASREEQIYRGALLWERQTWRAWPGCTGKRFGWGEKQTRL